MSTMPQSLTPEANQAIAVLRALTLSRKYPASLRELLREYKTMEGNPIHYKKFGFQSLEEFIIASGEFIVTTNQGEICLSAKPSKDSVHISEMVKRQRVPKRKGITPPQPRPIAGSSKSFVQNLGSIQEVNSNFAPKIEQQLAKRFKQMSPKECNQLVMKNSNENQNEQPNFSKVVERRQVDQPPLPTAVPSKNKKKKKSKLSSQRGDGQYSTHSQNSLSIVPVSTENPWNMPNLYRNSNYIWNTMPAQFSNHRGVFHSSQNSQYIQYPSRHLVAFIEALDICLELLFRQPYSTDQSWNKSSYSSNVFQKLPSSPAKKYSKSSYSNVNRNSSKSPGDSNNNSNNQNNRNTQNYPKDKKSNSANQPQQQQQHQSSKKSNSQMNGKQQQTSQMKDLRDKLNAQKQQATPTKTVPNISRTGSGNNLQERLQRNQISNNQQKNSTNNSSAENSKSNPTQTKLNSGQNNNPLPTSNLSNRLQRITNNALKLYQQPQIGAFARVEPGQLAVQSQSQLSPQSPPQSQPTSPVIVEPQSPSSSSGKSSIQDRLKVSKKSAAAQNGKDGIKQRGDSPSIVSNPTVIDKELNKTKHNESKPIVPPLVFEFNPNLDPVTSLAQYCTVRRYPKPDYKALKSRFSGLYQCRVLVNGIMYSTYPNEYPSEGVAKIASAVTAIEQIKITETKNRFPICPDSDVELAMKIFQMLNNHPNGMFCKNIPELFENTFKQTLPDHWISIIQSSNQFILEPTAGDNLIVYANLQTSESSGASTASDEFIVLDKITLPWEKKHWNLYITYCVSTIEVWARIVGKTYSDQLDSLMNDIDVYMLTDKARPISITCGQIYLVCISECWHRVRVEDMNKAEGSCLCFFIDFGDEEWLAMDQLFICEARFLKLSPQAIPFSLFGLEDFAENPNAKRHLDFMLIGKSLVGEILTKRDAYESNNECGDDFNAKIQVVLYDTSSNEDVNLNPLLLNKICDDTPPPELKRTGVTNVNVTSVASTGEIYLQVRNPGLIYVQKLIHQLVESKFKEEQYKVTEDDMKRSNLFLVQDADDKRWYRGSLAEGESKINDNTYNIFYVDYGLVKAINISKIFRLDSLSAALSKFPKQIVKAKLHNIPPVTESIVARIKGLLPPECPAIVKMAVHAVVPQIIVYRRFDVNEGLFNVNEVIRIEYELESNNILDLPESEKGLTVPGTGISRSKSDSPGPGQTSDLNYASNMRALSLKSPITVPSSPQRGDLPKLLSDINIPEIGSLFNVYVTMASNPGNFVVQPYDDGPKLVEMMTELQEYCLNNDEFIPVDMLEEGQAYAALNSDRDYQRVTVENILGSSMIHVHYCDFGDIAVLSNDKLKTLPAKFRNLPKQAISAKLYGVRPKDGDWTMDDCMRFKELTVGQKFVSVVKNITNDSVSPNTRILELELIDVSTDYDVYINLILVNENRAIPMPV